MIGAFSKGNYRIFFLNDCLSKMMYEYNKQITYILTNLTTFANFMKLTKNYPSY